jgi:cytochrome c oxidase assembly protein subunit 15
MSNNRSENIFFRKISLVTLLSVYFLILVGGIVRSTGAGMGCPDWPKCFGQWIPPTSEESLPDDYKEKYLNERLAKNQRFAGYLETIGFTKEARMLRTESSVRQETSFNPIKTWTEYINRLIGAVIGLLIFLNLLGSIKSIKSDPALFIWSFILFLLVVFQGWIGSVVVSTHLIPWMVSVHMIIAVIIIAVLTYLVYRSRRKELTFQRIHRPGFLNFLLITSGLLIVIQIILGTQVRESVDMIAASLNNQERFSWIQSAGIEFYIHRSFSLILLAMQVGILFFLHKSKSGSGGPFRFSKILLALIVAEIVFGVIMAYFGIPPFIQPVHLLTGVLIFGMQFLLLLMVNNVKEIHRNKVLA